jgi:hypothetical protein
MKSKFGSGTSDKVRSRAFRRGTTLCERTPCGLFEDYDGNKYIVTNKYLDDRNQTVGVAIALIHSHLRPFTWQILDQQPLGDGCWYGSYRIRLVNALAEECAMGFPGIVSIGDRHASIQCRDSDGACHMISLGYVGQKGFNFRDFDGRGRRVNRSRRSFF